MKTFSRREFLGASTMGLLAVRTLDADPMRRFAADFDAPLCFQSWVVQEQLGEDFDGTLKKLRAIGYDGVEMCSPRSYGDFAPAFGQLKDLSPSELKRCIEDTGLFCRSCHFIGSELLGENVPGTIEYAQGLGLKGLFMSSANFNEREASLDDWKRFAEGANAAGEVVKSAGLQMGYHNHMIGPVLEGKPQYDHLMELLEPDLVKMQFQVATISGGYDVIAYLDKYAGRYSALHLSDWDPQQERGVPVGDGAIDWPRLINAARQSDIEDYGYIVEVGSEEPLEGVVRSHAYLDQLTV